MDSVSDYDYELPEELIASEPLRRRDESRLLVVDRSSGRFHHKTIQDLPTLLNAGDCLVLNDTRVIPARLLGQRTSTGGKWEGLFLGTDESGHWRIICQSRGRLNVQEKITIHAAHRPDSSDELLLTLVAREEQGGVWIAEPESDAPVLDLLSEFGTVPLPPYIRRKLATQNDWERYQTTYAMNPGAVAAPTAGLHFTPELLAACTNSGIESAKLTLHVGIGTFRPVSVEKLSEHVMHSEWCELDVAAAAQINATRQAGSRTIAVGTTSVRTLESAAQNGAMEAFRGETDLFIRPPYEFQAVDGLLTNFHLPKSTLLVLVSAFADLELIREVYSCAIREGYRFYSYGDAMLIL